MGRLFWWDLGADDLALGAGCLALDAGGLALDADGFALDADGFALDADGFALDADGFALDADGFALDADGFALDADGLALGAGGLALGADGLALGADGFALDADSDTMGAGATALDAGISYLSTFSPDAIKKQKAVPLSMYSTPVTAFLQLVSSSTEAAEEASSAPSIETRPLSRENWCAHYVFRCFREIVSWHNNWMLPIHVYNRMNKWFFNREELVITTILCRAYSRLKLRHLVGRKHLVSSTVSVVHHHFHSPPSIYYM